MKNNLIAKHLWKSCKSHCLVPKTAYNRREDRGWCSFAQEEKLVEMWQRIQHAEAVKDGNIKPDYNHCWDSDISDLEAYRSIDYF